ncbi:MAG: DUF1549 and DUF1553 domain-containing protein [Planctomycetota bacterium]|nr:DUF1549 and DUF1553 domain-containing protein [Planctomycetota bacterium]
MSTVNLSIRMFVGLLAVVFLLGTGQILAVDPPADSAVPSSEEDSQHWSYRPVSRPEVPAVRATQWVRNPIDAFVLAQLEGRDWTPAPPASPVALMRRLYLDLIGLPPTMQEQKVVSEDVSARGFDKLVDKLLARKGYGERWGRHWLDLVRFAETNGYERDAIKPYVWRYRDYVIRSFNEDKPYDQFVLEQLAGDELENATSETLIATGFYRLGPWDDEPADFAEDRFDQLDDMLNVTSQTFLGITLACARCHDHKFEAYTQSEYYQVIAIFNPLQRPQARRSDLDSPAGSYLQIAKEEQRDLAIVQQDGQIHALCRGAASNFLEKVAVEEVKTTLPKTVIDALKVEWEKCTTEQRRQVRSHQTQIVTALTPWLDQKQREACRAALRAIADLQRETPDLPRGYFFVESSPQAPPTHLLLRGKANSPGPEVQPGVPQVLAHEPLRFLEPSPRTSQRRLSLAQWIAGADNPLTARVIVNRVWQHHFGHGIVRTPSDFGVMGAPPTHPRLLDWLAHWFAHEGGWSLKKLHRLILASNTYRMSAAWNDEYAAADPENNLLWRRSYRRLEVEAIRDSMLAISGKLDRSMYGPSMYPFIPAEILEGHADKLKIWPKFDERQANRRTIYAYVKRSMIVPFLEVMDLCDTTRPAPERLITSVAPQALTMLNGDFVNRQAGYFAERLVAQAGVDATVQIHLAYRLAFSREPTVREQDQMREFLRSETLRRSEEKEGRNEADARHYALTQMCRVILNLNELVYTD